MASPASASFHDWAITSLSTSLRWAPQSQTNAELVGYVFAMARKNNLLSFHRPLHGGLRVRNHISHGLLLSPPEKRTDHVLSRPDISCANDTPPCRP